MTYPNGRFPPSALAPIAGGGFLAKEDYRNPSAAGPAAAWNAMAAHVYRETGTRIAVTGPDSSYRSYPRQEYYYDLYLHHGGNLAAIPGYSNHGMGINVDVPAYVRALIDKYGYQFGWSKSWSDAANEWWHITYQSGHYSGKDPGPGYAVSANRFPTLKRGDDGKAVKRAQKHLNRLNLGVTRPATDGSFGPKTGTAVREFQKIHGLKPDGVIGKRTWAKLRVERALTPKEQTVNNRARLLIYGGISAGEEDQWHRYRAWIQRRLDQFKKQNLNVHNRRKRMVILRHTLNKEI